MAQYFEKNPSVKSEKRQFKWRIDNEVFTFNSDNGVFSKERVDFGSLTLINSFLEDGNDYHEILDLGCGYGPIGIILARLRSKIKIDMVDVNLRAVELANMNVASNRVKNLKAFWSDGFSKIGRKYDAILFNPPLRAGTEFIYQMYEQSREHLNENGALYIVVQKKQGAKSSMDKLRESYGNCECIDKKKGYLILKSVLNI